MFLTSPCALVLSCIGEENASPHEDGSITRRDGELGEFDGAPLFPFDVSQLSDKEFTGCKWQFQDDQSPEILSISPNEDFEGISVRVLSAAITGNSPERDGEWSVGTAFVSTDRQMWFIGRPLSLKPKLKGGDKRWVIPVVFAREKGTTDQGVALCVAIDDKSSTALTQISSLWNKKSQQRNERILKVVKLADLVPFDSPLSPELMALCQDVVDVVCPLMENLRAEPYNGWKTSITEIGHHLSQNTTENYT